MTRVPSSLYVMGIIDGPVKIGMSSDVSARMKQLHAQWGHVLVRHGEFPTAGAPFAERYAHWILRDKARGHEWFDATPEEACEVARRAAEAADKGIPLLPWIDRRGRPIQYAENVYLKFAPGTIARINALKPEDQFQTDFLRELVEDGLARRERPKAISKP